MEVTIGIASGLMVDLVAAWRNAVGDAPQADTADMALLLEKTAVQLRSLDTDPVTQGTPA